MLHHAREGKMLRCARENCLIVANVVIYQKDNNYRQVFSGRPARSVGHNLGKVTSGDGIFGGGL